MVDNLSTRQLGQIVRSKLARAMALEDDLVEASI